MKTIRIGSRDSLLAIAQTRLVMKKIAEVCPEITLELVTMKTTGDQILDRRLDEIGGKGLFVRELDQALLEGKVDLTVHSMKDLPMELHPDLPLLAVTERGDPRDALVFSQSFETDSEKRKASFAMNVGTSSLRRKLQLLSLYPAAEVSMIRGNIVTRLQKLDSGKYDALILAAAGLQRAGYAKRISRLFSVDQMIPPAGQGVLAVQGRKGEKFSFLQKIHCPRSELAVIAERGFVARLNGGCSSPVAAYAEVLGEELCLRGLYYQESTGRYFTRKMLGAAGGSPERLGIDLAEKLIRECEAQ